MTGLRTWNLTLTLLLTSVLTAACVEDSGGGGGGGLFGAASSCGQTCAEAIAVCPEAGYDQASCETDCRDLLEPSDHSCFRSANSCGQMQACLDDVIERLDSGNGVSSGPVTDVRNDSSDSSSFSEDDWQPDPGSGAGGHTDGAGADCYEFTCDAESTDVQCFESHDAFCDYACSSANCAAQMACEMDCL